MGNRFNEEFDDDEINLIVKKVKVIGVAMIAVIALVVCLTTGWYTVNEQESAVVLTMGKVTDVKEKGSGLQFKIPVFQSVKKVNMTTQGMEMGYTSTAPPDDESKKAGNNFVTNENESMMITNDFNIVAVDFYVEWRVTDPVKVLYTSSNPVLILRNIVQSSARDIVGTYSVDSVLTDGKSEIQGKVKELINKVLDRYDMGVLVTNVIIQDAEPPNSDVNVAFKAVEDAKQKKDTLLNEANKYYNEEIPGARAEANRITTSAEATKQARINEAEGQVSRFNAMFAEYINNTAITKSRMYYETMEEILPSLKLYIDGSNGSGNLLKILDLNEQSNTKAGVTDGN